MTFARMTLLLVAVLHFTWGLLLLVYGPIHSTELAWLMKYALGATPAGLILIALSTWTILIAARVTSHRSLANSIALALSMFTVMAPAAGSVAQVIAGRYADGAAYPREFIFTGQSNTILLAFLYIVAVIRLYNERQWTPQR